MRRVSVVGVPGAGKSTVGRELAQRLGSRFVELDAIHHQPGWTPLPREPFRARVAEELEADTWVVDGNYSAVQDLVWAAADTILWLDLPRPLMMRRVVTRTLRRAITREELWNGNREPLSGLVRWHPERNIIRWAWVQHSTYAQKYAAAMQDPANAHLRFVCLRSPAEVDAFLTSAT